MIAGLAESLTNFRGPLIASLQAKGIDIHVAAPDMPHGSDTRIQLEAKGITVHPVPMLRTGTNPLTDLRTLVALWWLMRRIRPDMVLGYTMIYPFSI